MDSSAGEGNNNAADKKTDRTDNTQESNEELDDTLENIEEKISDDEGGKEGKELNPEEEVACMNSRVPYELDKIESDADTINYDKEHVVIKSVLSREASGGSTDSKKNKRVTFHPSVGDSDQEVSEYAAEYDYPDCDDDVYEADHFQEGFEEIDEVMDDDGTEEDSGGTGYHDIKRSALYALRRGERWSDGEGDGEKADVGDHSEDETLVDDPDASFGEAQEEDSMYPDEFVDDAGEIVDSEEEFMEHLEDVDVPPELEGIDPYLLASMLEEIQEQQDREGSHSGKSGHTSSLDNTETFQGFIDKFTVQILEGAAEDLYQLYETTGDLLDESDERIQETPGLEVIPEVDSSEDRDDDNDSSDERKNSSGFIKKENLVQNLQEIISELSEAEKPPSECSVESGALLLDDDTDPVDFGPTESSPIPSPEVKQTVNLFQAMKKKAQISFNITESEQTLFEGDLFSSEVDLDVPREENVMAAKDSKVESSYDDDSGLHEMIWDANDTVVESIPKGDTNEIGQPKKFEVVENISARAERMSRHILDSALTLLSVSHRKRSLGDDSSPSSRKVAKLDLSVQTSDKKGENLSDKKKNVSKIQEKAIEFQCESSESMVQINAEAVNLDAESQVHSKQECLDELDFTVKQKIKTRKKFNRKPHKMKSRFSSQSLEAERIKENYKIEYAHADQGILFGSDKFQIRSTRKPVIERKYPGFYDGKNYDSGHLAAHIMYEQYLIARANWYQSGISLDDSKEAANGEVPEGFNAAQFDKSDVQWNIISEKSPTSDFSQPFQTSQLLKSSSVDQRPSKDQHGKAKCESHDTNEPGKYRDAAGIDDVDLTIREKVKTRKKFNRSVLQVKFSCS